jgi:hypothetical protein
VNTLASGESRLEVHNFRFSAAVRLRRWPRRPAISVAALAALTAALAVPALPASAAQAATHTAGAAKAAAASRGKALLTQGQALAQARRTGKRVQVTGSTTDSSTLTANPAGTFTLTETNMPVRAEVHGTWKPLNATLHRNADGTVSPAVTSSPLTLSGGGTRPLASMTQQGHTLSLSFPQSLPAPTLSGATATYANVPVAGADLKVTADGQGGFETVLVVSTAKAAASPALRSFTLRPSAPGLVLHASAKGDITASTRTGRTIFEIPSAAMWDSRDPATVVPTGMDPAYGRRVDLRDGLPVTSADDGPGENARTAAVSTRLHDGILTYTPSRSVLTGKGTTYPVYIDPSAGGALQYWAQVDNAWPSQTYPKPSLMQVGYNGWESPYFTARSFVRMSVSGIAGSSTDVESAKLYLTDEYAPTCNTSAGDFGVQVWLTGGISSGTDWSNQPTWETEQQEKAFSHGYNSTCPAASEGFTVTSAMTSAAHDSWSQVTFGLKADNESDQYGWKQFDDTATLSTTYDKPPSISAMATSPSTSCPTGSVPTTVGDGDVALDATLADPLGSNASPLTASIFVTDATSGAAVPGSPFEFGGLGNKGIATELLAEATLKKLAGTAITKFSWYARVTDGTLTSANSATCSFDYDPNSPGAPVVTATATSYTIGTAAAFDVTPDPSGATPTSYTYQVNGAAPESVIASSSGTAKINVTPTSGAGALTVTAVSAGGNVGDSATVYFTAAAPALAADGDLTGDGIPDLVTPGGGGTGLAPGLWLARAQAAPGGKAGDGQLIASPVDVGEEGDAIAGDYSASDFTGSQVITGEFSDDNLQDYLVYFPPGSSSPAATGGVILDGTGDGTIEDNENFYNYNNDLGDSAFSSSIGLGTLADANNDSPLQLANAYNSDPNDNAAYPDLVGPSGDSTNGYYLDYYQNANTGGSWLPPLTLSTATPDGIMNWNDWQITTMQDPAGYTDMFLYDSAASVLYLWTDFTVNDSAGTASFTQYKLSSSWAPGTLTELRAANITGNGPALWAVTNTGTVTAWTTSALNSAAGTGTGTITPQPSQSLLSPTHDWRLGDSTTGEATSAADSGTGGNGPTFPETGSGGATWNTKGGLFSPDVSFDGSSGSMTGTSGIGGITATSNYTVSAWVKPSKIAGVVFAESDATTNESCMDLYLATVTSSTGATYGAWNFGTTNNNTATPTTTVATTGGTYAIKVGTWTHLTVTYDAATKYMEVYVDGVPAAGVTASTVWSSGCTSFELAHSLEKGGIHSYFPGEIADVQTWLGTVLNPTEIATDSGTPGYDLFASDNTQYISSAYQWQTACADMQFYQGKLTIKETCSGTTTMTEGPGSYPNAVLTLQKDGNFVIYQDAADATAANTGTLWASNTSGDSGDSMFLQPDGNLVIYGTYGNLLWESATYN